MGPGYRYERHACVQQHLSDAICLLMIHCNAIFWKSASRQDKHRRDLKFYRAVEFPGVAQYVTTHFRGGCGRVILFLGTCLQVAVLFSFIIIALFGTNKASAMRSATNLNSGAKWVCIEGSFVHYALISCCLPRPTAAVEVSYQSRCWHSPALTLRLVLPSRHGCRLKLR